MDFGMSKIEVKRNPKAIKNMYRYGSKKYLILKVLKKRFQTIIMYPFQVYIYLFAMICYKMLSKKDPFCDV